MGDTSNSKKYGVDSAKTWVVYGTGWKCLICGYISQMNVPCRHTIPSPVKGDMKAGLTNGKPQLSQFPLAAMIYATRAFEYGSSKYERGNYLRPTVDTLADFDRLLAYIDAGLRHLTKITLEMNRVRGCTEMSKVDLMTGAICTDLESGLPHLCGAITSIAMGIQQAVDAGLIPADPGRPWEKQKKE